MHRSGAALCKFGVRGRAEERHQWEEEGEEEFDKKARLGCISEQAVHLIPLLLLACLLILYIFSYTPAEGSVPENARLTNHVKELKTGNIQMISKEEVLQTFSVYNHRSLHQLQKNRQSVNRNNLMKPKEIKQLFNKGNKHDIRRTGLKKNSLHRKTRILHTH
ncbi:hypothetical protein KI387_002793 [Taxus chinensis]|uniref:Uncharacterized protein n=1 Tax=Taxus chinensis TaxID=29808 RepID=A0AA38GZZ5_TAXCH|nr:hypothetical protein KI387_002793 [Taxus chinensis]